MDEIKTKGSKKLESLLIDILNQDSEKIKKLLSLTYKDKDEKIINLKDPEVLMEIIGMFKKGETFDSVLKFIQNAPNREYILWEQEFMNEYKNKIMREVEVQQIEETGVKGIDKCRFCGSDRLVFVTRQIRSGDEPATIFIRCVTCGRSWKQ
ncbi:MAG: hypothetical protein QXG00_07800 [Candidatus Woesearchaeota archaeon]